MAYSWCFCLGRNIDFFGFITQPTDKKRQQRKKLKIN